MKRWAIIATLALVVVITVTIGAVLQSGVPVQAARVERGTIHEYIDERGKTRLPRIVRISMPQAGRVEAIKLQEGDRVEAGLVVARIIGQDLENAVAEAQAVVERLDAAIAENDNALVEMSLAVQARQFVESMNNTVDAAKAQADVSSKRADFAEMHLGRVQKLHPTGGSSDDDLDRATLAYCEGQSGLQQDLLTWESMKSIRAATALLPKMVDDYIANKKLTRAVLEKQKSEAEAHLRQIVTQRDRGTMCSEIGGVVLQRAVQNEQQLPAGTELLQIGDLNQLEVEADILSQDVVRVQVNDRVEVYGPTVGTADGRSAEGVVYQIFPAGFTKTSSLGVEQQRVRVIIRFSPESKELLRNRDLGVDYRVRVRIFTATKTGTLTVPRAAIFRGPDNRWQLFTIEGSQATLQTVETGLINDTHVEITQGLEEGQLVILAPDIKLEHGKRVRQIPK